MGETQGPSPYLMQPSNNDQYPGGEELNRRAIEKTLPPVYSQPWRRPCAKCGKFIQCERHHILSVGIARVLVRLQLGAPATDAERNRLETIVKHSRKLAGDANLCCDCHRLANERQKMIEMALDGLEFLEYTGTDGVPVMLPSAMQGLNNGGNHNEEITKASNEAGRGTDSPAA